MGTDIHFFTEKRASSTSPWESADTWVPDKYAPTGKAPQRLYTSRCYDLFAILANVRNGWGFAGVPTGEGFVPISEPRGLPADLSPEVVGLFDDGCGGDHSYSWLGLDELLAFNWLQTNTKQGWANLDSWVRWYRPNRRGPPSYSGAIAGPSIVHIEASEMEARIQQYRDLPYPNRQPFIDAHTNHYALAVWSTTYAIASGTDWWCEAIPALLAIATNSGGPSNVRIVFGFDS